MESIFQHLSKMTDELLTAGQAAAVLKCDRRTLANYRRAGRIKAVGYSPRKFMFHRSEVERFQREGSAV